MVDSNEEDKFDLGVKGLRISFVFPLPSFSRGEEEVIDTKLFYRRYRLTDVYFDFNRK